MKRLLSLGLLAGLLGLASCMGACGKKTPLVKTSPAPAILGPNDGVSRVSLESGGHTFFVEVARTEAEREQGLMFRTRLAKDCGMVFVYEPDEVDIKSFWMKNCKMDLDIAYVDTKGFIVSIARMNAPEPGDLHFPGYSSVYPCQFAIEMAPGWFAKHGIKVGDKVTGLRAFFE